MNHLVRHLFVSDFHIPDYNKEAFKAILEFISDFKPDYVHILGDFLDFGKASDFLVIGGVCPTLGEEIKIGTAVLYDLVSTARKANKKVIINWFCGNHEYRLERFLAKSDNVLGDIQGKDGELLVSIPHIFELKEMGVNWIPYYVTYQIHDMVLEHGRMIRSKSGATAQAQIDKYGKSGASAHSHRACLIIRKVFNNIIWWIEDGCMCNLEPSLHWIVKPDWVNAFGVAIYNPKTNRSQPYSIVMQDNHFYYDGKVY